MQSIHFRLSFQLMKSRGKHFESIAGNTIVNSDDLICTRIKSGEKRMEALFLAASTIKMA